MKEGFLPMLAAGLLGGGVTAGALLGTGAAGDRVTRTVVQSTALGAAASPVARGESTLTARTIYRRNAAGVVFVRARSVQNGPSSLDLSQRSENLATGSGFVIDDLGHLLTTAHVVAGATDIRVTFSDERTVDARVVGKDEETDLAVLAVEPAGLDLRPLVLGESGSVQVGDWTVALGNPFGFDRTLTTGVISAKQRRITAPSGFSVDNVLQTDAAMNPASSGGPLLDATGRVIGVTSQIATAAGTGGSVGVGFAVPIDTAKAVVPELQRHHTVSRAYLGITGRGLEESLVSLGGADVGVYVQDVDPEGPAARAGILGAGVVDTRGGDVITAVDGEAVRSMADVDDVLERRRPGDGVPVRLVRDGSELTVQVELQERPASVPLG